MWVFRVMLVLPALLGVLTVLHAVGVEHYGWVDPLGQAGVERRLGLYDLATTAASILVALMSTGLGLYLASQNPRIAWVRSQAGQHGRRVWTRAILSLLAVVLASMVSFLLEPQPNATDLLGPRFLFQFALLLAIARCAYAMIFFVGQANNAVKPVRDDFSSLEPDDLMPPAPMGKSR
jgi:hypothetical protein